MDQMNRHRTLRFHPDGTPATCAEKALVPADVIGAAGPEMLVTRKPDGGGGSGGAETVTGMLLSLWSKNVVRMKPRGSDPAGSDHPGHAARR